MEARRRPLRTYSKRTAPTESSEPVAKRQCLPAPAIKPVQDEEMRCAPPSEPEHRATTSTSKPSTSLPPIKKGTITAYFGRAAPPPPPVVTSSSDPPSDPLSEPNEPTITPPSSPPAITTMKRKVRRLKARAVAQRIREDETDETEQEGDEEEKEQTGRTSEVHDGESPPEDTAPTVALSEIAPNTLNQPEKEGGKSQQRKRKREKRKKAPSVQTTLSLSMREEALYTECKECGMLYNHLHQTDVKYHARRHAALLRAKALAVAAAEGAEGDE